GDTVILIFPRTPAGKPLFLEISVQESPPSVDLNRPLPSPPLSIRYGLRLICQNAAYIVFGFDGSSIRSLAPVSELRYRIFCQVFPPSRVRTIARSLFLPQGWPRGAT